MLWKPLLNTDRLWNAFLFKPKTEEPNLLSRRINSSRSDKFDDVYETGENTGKFEFQNDEKLTKLPPLFNKNGDEFLNENSNVNEDGRYSSMSTNSSNSRNTNRISRCMKKSSPLPPATNPNNNKKSNQESSKESCSCEKGSSKKSNCARETC